jgi:hypothetical protein
MAPVLDGVADQDEMGVLRGGDVVDEPRRWFRAYGQSEGTVGLRVDVLIHYFLNHLAPSVLPRQPRQELK